MIFRQALLLPFLVAALSLPEAWAVIRPTKIKTGTEAQKGAQKVNDEIPLDSEGSDEDFYGTDDYSIEDYDHEADEGVDEYEEYGDPEAAGDLEDQKEAEERLHGACGGHDSEDHETGAGNCQEDRNELRNSPESISPIMIKATKKSKKGKAGNTGTKKIMPIPCRGVRSDGSGAGKYGSPRRNKKRRYTHTGVDWNSPLGSPFKSVAAGKVTSAACSKRAGCTIRVTHTDGTRAVYMHLSPKFSVKAGAKVKQGQVLGKTSNTGNAKGTNPHLHFEYYSTSGKRLNPTSVFGCK